MAESGATLIRYLATQMVDIKFQSDHGHNSIGNTTMYFVACPHGKGHQIFSALMHIGGAHNGHEKEDNPHPFKTLTSLNSGV